MTLLSVIPSPVQILTGAAELLAERGRAYGDWEYGENLCILAAMAVAVGRTPDYWDEVREAGPDELEDVDDSLIKAARLLAGAIDNPVCDPDALSVEDLIEVISNWHDGDPDSDRGYVNAPPNWRVFLALAKAAQLTTPAVTA
jgi:hypothetical protein